MILKQAFAKSKMDIERNKILAKTKQAILKKTACLLQPVLSQKR